MIKAFGDYIVLKRLGEQRSKSGVIDPDSSDSSIAVIEDAEPFINLETKVTVHPKGLKVAFEKGSEQELKFQGETYLLVHKDKIKAILED